MPAETGKRDPPEPAPAGPRRPPGRPPARPRSALAGGCLTLREGSVIVITLAGRGLLLA